MDESATPLETACETTLPDRVSVRRWFAFYAALLAAAAVTLIVLVPEQDGSWQAWRSDFSGQLRDMSPAVKLIILAVYVSLATTFLPLPVNVVVAAVALKPCAVGDSLLTTSLIVAAVAGAASTVANLNDYHLFTLLLRSHRVAKVRHTRLYEVSSTWFARSPFAILSVFNIVPIPIDVVRMLATTCRYPRGAFAAANFLGRFVRYFIIAAVTYALGEDYGWVSIVVLLAVALAGVGVKLVHWAARKQSLPPQEPSP